MLGPVELPTLGDNLPMGRLAVETLHAELAPDKQHRLVYDSENGQDWIRWNQKSHAGERCFTLWSWRLGTQAERPWVPFLCSSQINPGCSPAQCHQFLTAFFERLAHLFSGMGARSQVYSRSMSRPEHHPTQYSFLMTNPCERLQSGQGW